MADLITPNLGLTKPQVGASRSTWGGKLNDNFDLLDAIGPLPPAGDDGAFGMVPGQGWQRLVTVEAADYGAHPTKTGGENFAALTEAIAQANALEAVLAIARYPGAYDVQGGPLPALLGPGIIQRGTVLSNLSPLAAGEAFLTIGDALARRFSAVVSGIAVSQPTVTQWGGGEAGVRLLNLGYYSGDLALVEGFETSLHVLADNQNVTQFRLVLPWLRQSRRGVLLEATGASGFIGSARLVGGWHDVGFSSQTAAMKLLDRWAIVMKNGGGAPPAWNAITLRDFSFQGGRNDGTVSGRAFMLRLEGNVTPTVRGAGLRAEAASLEQVQVADTADALQVMLDYDHAQPSDAGDLVPLLLEGTRASPRGGVIAKNRRYNAGGVMEEQVRPVLRVPNVRRALQWSQGFIYLPGAVLANMSGGAAAQTFAARCAYAGALNQANTPALFEPKDGALALVASRGVGVILDCRRGHAFAIRYALAAAAAGGRVFVIPYDASGAVLAESDATRPLVMAMGAPSLAWNGAIGAYWNGSDNALGDQRQAVRLAPSVAFALLGVMRGSANADLVALECDALEQRLAGLVLPGDAAFAEAAPRPWLWSSGWLAATAGVDQVLPHALGRVPAAADIYARVTANGTEVRVSPMAAGAMALGGQIKDASATQLTWSLSPNGNGLFIAGAIASIPWANYQVEVRLA